MLAKPRMRAIGGVAAATSGAGSWCGMEPAYYRKRSGLKMARYDQHSLRFATAAKFSGWVCFLTGDKVNAQGPELSQCMHQLLNGTSEAIKPPHENYIEFAATGVLHKIGQAGTILLRSADAIGVHPSQRPTPLVHHLAEGHLLDLRILLKGVPGATAICSTDPNVNGGPFHFRTAPSTETVVNGNIDRRPPELRVGVTRRRSSWSG